MSRQLLLSCDDGHELVTLERRGKGLLLQVQVRGSLGADASTRGLLLPASRGFLVALKVAVEQALRALGEGA